MTKNQRTAILAKTNGHCAYCGTPLNGRWQVDHMHPIIRSSRYATDENGQFIRDEWGRKLTEKYVTHPERDTFDNLWPACCSCNNYKNGNPLESFRKSIARQIEILRRDRPTFRLAERYGLIKCEEKEVIFYFETL